MAADTLPQVELDYKAIEILRGHLAKEVNNELYVQMVRLFVLTEGESFFARSVMCDTILCSKIGLAPGSLYSYIVMAKKFGMFDIIKKINPHTLRRSHYLVWKPELIDLSTVEREVVLEHSTKTINNKPNGKVNGHSNVVVGETKTNGNSTIRVFTKEEKRLFDWLGSGRDSAVGDEIRISEGSIPVSEDENDSAIDTMLRVGVLRLHGQNSNNGRIFILDSSKWLETAEFFQSIQYKIACEMERLNAIVLVRENLAQLETQLAFAENQVDAAIKALEVATAKVDKLRELIANAERNQQKDIDDDVLRHRISFLQSALQMGDSELRFLQDILS